MFSSREANKKDQPYLGQKRLQNIQIMPINPPEQQQSKAPIILLRRTEPSPFAGPCPACPVGRHYRTGVKCLPHLPRRSFKSYWGETCNYSTWAKLIEPGAQRQREKPPFSASPACPVGRHYRTGVKCIT
jgi:hypothetical protein